MSLREAVENRINGEHSKLKPVENAQPIINADESTIKTDEILTVDESPTLTNPSIKTSRRKLSGNKLIVAASLMAVASAGFGYGIGFNPLDLGKATASAQLESNPYHIGEGQPRNGTLNLDTSHEVIASVLNKHLGWIPDGRSPYVTVKDDNGDNVRRYFFSGGPGNASYMVQTDFDHLLS